MTTEQTLLEHRMAHEALAWLVEAILVTTGPGAMQLIADQYERQNKARFEAMMASEQTRGLVHGLESATTARLARIRGMIATQRSAQSQIQEAAAQP